MRVAKVRAGAQALIAEASAFVILAKELATVRYAMVPVAAVEAL